MSAGSSLSHKLAHATPKYWHVVDARGQVVGRLATQISSLLQGKHKPLYVPNSDCGDWVVVVNAKDVALSGKKSTEKLYRWHTGYPGGLKTLSTRQLFEKAPERVLEKAVYGMLPRSSLRKKWLKKLRIYAGDAHEHEANTLWSEQTAPEYMEKYAPKPATLRAKDETGDFVVDYVPEEGEIIE